ncbi:MAG: 50S ribosomal protein L22 [Calditrichaeota bacterium]|nr:MAG: 50S ribosomal protein L22 [Calditrichota bacterium]
MEAVARSKYVRMSPFKVRRVVNLIKGKNVEDALNILHFSPKRASKTLEKTLRSAVANFFLNEEAAHISPHDIYVKKVLVDEGPTLRRFRPMSMGRAGRIRRRTSHITIVVESKVNE